MKFNSGKRALLKELSWAGCALIWIVTVFPFLWGVLTSLKPARELMMYPPRILGSRISLEHYRTVLSGSFTQAALNSILYNAVTVALCAVFALLAGYAMTRFHFRGKKAVFYLVVFAIPLSMGSAALVVPNYVMLSAVGMVNRWITLPLIYVTYNLPMAVWIFIGAMQNVPYAVEEAAQIDGASRWHIIFIMVPRLCLPVIACASLLTFIGAWNEFTISSVLVNSQKLYPIQVSIYNYIGYFGREWGPLTAAASLAVVPVLVVFTCLGKLLISGLTLGAVKE